ncbi:helix-turn-helix domain-containing protein [Streptomyces sp. NPDC048428]|uniref:RICIN domain-containing protein n=1 Tax=Streptomyces sp. NPDC048428 TaxID=3154503 RepID=UPI003441C3EC
MNTTGGAEPEHADTVEQFVALMKRLKDASGLTYRQLEERAEREGRVLPRSTIADVLRRHALPRPHMLNAFVHACGAGEHAEAWLQARNRLALGGGSAHRSTEEAPARDGRAALPSASPADDDDAGTSGLSEGGGARGRSVKEGAGHSTIRPEPGALPRWLRHPHRAVAPRLLVSLVTVLLVGIASWLILPGDPGKGPAATAPSSQDPATGWYSIRPVRATGLCVTEGREPGGDTVAVQRACSPSTPPYTRLDPLGGGRYFVKWVHPVHGWGCLTVLTSGLLEPWDDCRSSRTAQVFTFERVGAAGTPASPTGGTKPYRIRSASDGRCIGISGTDPKAASGVAVAGPCTDSAAQHFLLTSETEPAANALPSASG